MTRHPDTDTLDPAARAELDALEAALRGDPADPEWGALVAAVREEPPPRRLQDTASLDARVSAGFPRTRPRWAVLPSLPSQLLPGLAVASVVLVFFGVIGLAAFQDGAGSDEEATPAASSSTTASTATEESAAASSAAQDEAAPAAADEAAPSGRFNRSVPAPAAGEAAPSASALRDLSRQSAPPAPAASPAGRRLQGFAAGQRLSGPRSVERTTTLAMRTTAAKLQEASGGIVRATQDLGGVVETSQVDSSPGGGTSSFVLRLPTARVDEALKRFGELADVRRLSQGALDITGSVVSARDRLSDAREERQALLRALGRATTDRSVASLRARLRENRASIARREAAVRRLRTRADTARVDVTLRGSGAAAPAEEDGGAWGPGDAARDALRVLEVLGGVLLIALAVAAPFALLGGLAALAGHAVRRRRREGALGAA